jgi:hypothetical protein
MEDYNETHYWVAGYLMALSVSRLHDNGWQDDINTEIQRIWQEAVMAERR